MALDIDEDFEGGSAGANLTTGNTAFTAILGTAPTFTTTAHRGALAMQASASSATSYCSKTYTSRGNIYVRFFIRFSAAPAANTIVCQVLSSATIRAQLRINTALTVTMRNGTTAVYTSTETLSTGTWFRGEWDLINGTGQTLRVYDDAGTLVFNSGTQTFNTGTHDRVQPGISAAATWTVLFDDFATDDTSNPGPLGTTIALGVAAETDTAAAVTPVKQPRPGPAAETSTAHPLVIVELPMIGAAAETDTALHPIAAKIIPIPSPTSSLFGEMVFGEGVFGGEPSDPVPEADTAGQVTVLVAAAVDAAAGTETGLPVAAAKIVPVGGASTSDAASPVGHAVGGTVQHAAETGTAAAVLAVKTVPVGPAAETSAAYPAPAARVVQLQAAGEASTGHPVVPVVGAQVGPAGETSTAGSVQPAHTVPVGAASGTETAGPVAAVKQLAVHPAGETGTAAVLPAVKTVPVGVASETGAAGGQAPVKAVHVGAAVETDTAWQVAVNGTGTAVLSPVAETDTAAAVQVAKQVPVGPAAETDTSGRVYPVKAIPVGAATQTDSAATVTGGYLVGVQPAAGTDSAGGVVAVRAAHVGAAAETSTAAVLGSAKPVPVGAPVEADTAGAVAGARVVPVGAAAETSTAAPITVVKLVAAAVAGETGTAVVVRASRGVPVGVASTTGTARALALLAKLVAVGRATETSTAAPVTLAGPQVITLGAASGTETAGPVAAVTAVKLGGLMYAQATHVVTVLRGTTTDAFGDVVDTGAPVATGVQVSILERSKRVFVPADGRWEQVRYYAARFPARSGVASGDQIIDEVTGDGYVIDDVDVSDALVTTHDLRCDLRRVT